MNKLAALGLLALCAAMLPACSIKQEVQPLTDQPETSICLIEDKDVRAGFLSTYQRTLQARGYAVRLLPKGSTVKDCPLTSTYIGYWNWDLALYLVEARIEVFRDGLQVGKAEYNARRGGANMGKFVKGEKKIAELVGQLFPNAAGTGRQGSKVAPSATAPVTAATSDTAASHAQTPSQTATQHTDATTPHTAVKASASTPASTPVAAPSKAPTQTPATIPNRTHRLTIVEKPTPPSPAPAVPDTTSTGPSHTVESAPVPTSTPSAQ